MAEQLSIDKNKTVLLIMDYQNRQLSNFSESFQKELLTRANKVLAGARQAGIPVIYVEVQRGQRTPETEIHPAVTPKTGELVLTKRGTGPFASTNLDEVLKRQGIKTLILMGISTSGCVLSTVRWAADMDYQLIVLSDCCADRDDEVQRVLMEKLFPRQAKVISSTEILPAIGRI
ncbi:MAG: cysteine hydrolase [Chloroflexi bacterium]|nr:cysteine hydrolase [Chloroflexota bacterium]